MGVQERRYCMHRRQESTFDRSVNLRQIACIRQTEARSYVVQDETDCTKTSSRGRNNACHSLNETNREHQLPSGRRAHTRGVSDVPHKTATTAPNAFNTISGCLAEKMIDQQTPLRLASLATLRSKGTNSPNRPPFFTPWQHALGMRNTPNSITTVSPKQVHLTASPIDQKSHDFVGSSSLAS